MSDVTATRRSIQQEYGWAPVVHFVFILGILAFLWLMPESSELILPFVIFMFVAYTNMLVYFSVRALRRVEERLEALAKANAELQLTQRPQ